MRLRSGCVLTLQSVSHRGHCNCIEEAYEKVGWPGATVVLSWSLLSISHLQKIAPFRLALATRL